MSSARPSSSPDEHAGATPGRCTGSPRRPLRDEVARSGAAKVREPRRPLLPAGQAAVDRARAAHHLACVMGMHGERFARIRDEAVVGALASGVAIAWIAQALEVEESEVRGMAGDYRATALT